MTTYTVNMPAMQDIASNMGTIAAQIQSLIEELETSTAQTLADWVSSARDYYNQAKGTWDAAAGLLPIQASKAMSSLNSIADNYSAAESAGASMWG